VWLFPFASVSRKSPTRSPTSAAAAGIANKAHDITIDKTVFIFIPMHL
jgi:hypothetical protein